MIKEWIKKFFKKKEEKKIKTVVLTSGSEVQVEPHDLLLPSEIKKKKTVVRIFDWSLTIWGRTGFDMDNEMDVAARDVKARKIGNLKIIADDYYEELALAA